MKDDWHNSYPDFKRFALEIRCGWLLLERMV